MVEETKVICVPGQRLVLADENNTSGFGTYERNGYIYATLAGVVEVAKNDKTTVISVHNFNNQTIVPAPGDVVTAKVLMVSHRFCKCDIISVGDINLSHSYRAMLRREHIRATEKDRIEVYKCFRPGDIILARVLPVKELHSYQITTAENELGVVYANGAAGVPLVPMSWTEMQCPKTYVKEPRKVAKIIPEHAVSTD